MRVLARYSLCLLLAGCTAQASVNEGNQMDLTTAKMIGRVVSVPERQNQTVLDWRSDDIGAEEMLITLGITRPVFNKEGVDQTLRSPVEDLDAIGTGYNPKFLIEYGIEGNAVEILVDAIPEQSFTVPASFIRITAISKQTGGLLPSNPLHFYATVCRAVSKSPGLARHSVRVLINAGATLTIPIQPFARKALISWLNTATITPQASTISFVGGINFGVFGLAIFSKEVIAANVNPPVFEIPSGADRIEIINNGANAQVYTITQYLDP